MNKLVNFIRTEPAVILLTVNALLALCVAWGVADITAKNMGVLMTISTGVLSFVVALLARPPAVPVMKGAAATLVVAFASFGVLHLTADRIAATTAVLSIFLGLMFRTNLTPVVPTPPTGGTR